VDTYEQAQVARNSGQLLKALDQLTVCVKDSCPEFVKVDCGQWLSEIKREVPSTIFSAIDSAGEDLTAVRVTVDGKVVAESLAGLAVEMDPGQHEVSFEYDGKKVTKSIIVRQGEKNRVFRGEFETSVDSDGDGVNDEADLCPDTPGALGADGCPRKLDLLAESSSPATGGSRLPAYILWGVGGAGLATFGVFGLLGRSQEDKAIEECAKKNSMCSEQTKQDYLDEIDQKLLIASIGLGVGATGAVVGTVLFFLSGPSHADKAAASSPGLNLDVAGGPQGGFVNLQGSF
jgi:hypothetical protein